MSGSDREITMILKIMTAIAIALAPALVAADPPVRLSGGDVYFQFAGLADDRTNDGRRLAKSTKTAATHLCGFTIRGNHYSHANPHIEWDLNIDQIVTKERSVAGVSAGTFEVTNHKRTARAPITDLSFTLEGSPDPIVAAILGTPNADNGVVALIESEPASRLFTEFQTMRAIVISMRYADGASDQIEVRGFRDNRTTVGDSNSYFNQCIKGFITGLGGTGHRPIK